MSDEKRSELADMLRTAAYVVGIVLVMAVCGAIYQLYMPSFFTGADR